MLHWVDTPLAARHHEARQGPPRAGDRWERKGIERRTIGPGSFRIRRNARCLNAQSNGDSVASNLRQQRVTPPRANLPAPACHVPASHYRAHMQGFAGLQCYEPVAARPPGRRNVLAWTRGARGPRPAASPALACPEDGVLRRFLLPRSPADRQFFQQAGHFRRPGGQGPPRPQRRNPGAGHAGNALAEGVFRLKGRGCRGGVGRGRGGDGGARVGSSGVRSGISPCGVRGEGSRGTTRSGLGGSGVGRG